MTFLSFSSPCSPGVELFLSSLVLLFLRVYTCALCPRLVLDMWSLFASVILEEVCVDDGTGANISPFLSLLEGLRQGDETQHLILEQ